MGKKTGFLFFVTVCLLAGCGGTSSSSSYEPNEELNGFQLSADQQDLAIGLASYPLSISLSGSTFQNSLSASSLTLGGAFSGMSLSNLLVDGAKVSFTLSGAFLPSGGSTLYENGSISFPLEGIAGSITPATAYFSIEDNHDTLNESTFQLENGLLSFEVGLDDDVFQPALQASSFLLGQDLAKSVNRLDDKKARVAFSTSKGLISLAIQELFVDKKCVTIKADAITHAHDSKIAYVFSPLGLDATLKKDETQGATRYLTFTVSPTIGSFIPTLAAGDFMLEEGYEFLRVSSFTMEENHRLATLILQSSDLTFDALALGHQEFLSLYTAAFLYPWGENGGEIAPAYREKIAHRIPLSSASKKEAADFLRQKSRILQAASSSPTSASASSSDFTVQYGPDDSTNDKPDTFYFDMSEVFSEKKTLDAYTKAETFLEMFGRGIDVVGQVLEHLDSGKEKGEAIEMVGSALHIFALITKVVGVFEGHTPQDMEVKALRAICGGMEQLSDQIKGLSQSLALRQDQSVVRDFMGDLRALSDSENTIHDQMGRNYFGIYGHMPAKDNNDVSQFRPVVQAYLLEHATDFTTYTNLCKKFYGDILADCTESSNPFNPFRCMETIYSQNTVFLNEKSGDLSKLREMILLELNTSYGTLLSLVEGDLANKAAKNPTISISDVDLMAAAAQSLSGTYTNKFAPAVKLIKTMYNDPFHFGIRHSVRNDGYYTAEKNALVFTSLCLPLHMQVAFKVIPNYTEDKNGDFVAVNGKDAGILPVCLRDRFFAAGFVNGSVDRKSVHDYCSIINRFYQRDWYAPYRVLGAPELSLANQVGVDTSKKPDAWRYGVRGYFNGRYKNNSEWGCYDIIWHSDIPGYAEDSDYHLTYETDKKNSLKTSSYRWTPYYVA